MKKVLWTIVVMFLIVLGFGVFDLFFNGKLLTQNLCEFVIDTNEVVSTQVDKRITILEEEVQNLNTNLEKLISTNQDLIDRLLDVQVMEITDSSDLVVEVQNDRLSQPAIQESFNNESDEEVISKEELDQMRELLEKLQSVE